MSAPFPLALSLRMWLMAHELTASVMTGIIFMITVGYHLSWHVPARRTMGVAWRDWTTANNGYVFGLMRQPSRAQWLANARGSAMPAKDETI
eukprot:1132334-Prymnesium_polylepis.1